MMDPTNEQPYQPPTSEPVLPIEPNSEERTMGMLCHLLGIVAGHVIGLGFVGPLILWLIKKDSSAFIDHQGKEALNFQLTVLLAVVALSITGFLLLIIGIGLLFFLLIIVVDIAALIIAILACVAANRGEWYRYPLSIRFVS